MPLSLKLTSSLRTFFFQRYKQNSPFVPDNSVAFPKMAAVEESSTGGRGDPEQPEMDACGMWIWPDPDVGVKRKAVKGQFVTDKYLTPTTLKPPLDPEFYACQQKVPKTWFG